MKASSYQYYTHFQWKQVLINSINSTSLRIGDYEALMAAAIDPYVSIRDAYIQYRMKEVKARKAMSVLFKNTGEDQTATGLSSQPEK